MLLIFVEYGILAATFTLAKVAVTSGAPLFLLMVRMLIAGFFLMLYEWGRRGIAWEALLRDRGLYLHAILFHVFFAFVPEFWALQYISSTKTSLLYALTPFIAAILSYFLEGERLSKRQLAGIVVSFAAMLPVLVSGGVDWVVVTGAECVLLGAVVSATYAWFIIKRLLKRGHSIACVNGVAFFGGGILCAISFGVFEWGNAVPAITDAARFWPALIALVVVAHGVSYPLYSFLIKKYSITFMTLCGFFVPLCTALYGVIFLGEPFVSAYAWGIGGLAAGLMLFSGVTPW